MFCGHTQARTSHKHLRIQTHTGAIWLMRQPDGSKHGIFAVPLICVNSHGNEDNPLEDGIPHVFFGQMHDISKTMGYGFGKLAD